MKMKYLRPDFSHEKRLWQKDFLVIGVDEVGRGCLAGPLVVGAVCFNIFCKPYIIDDITSCGINDSKLLSTNQREKMAKIIKEKALFYATEQVSVSVINKHGIVTATQIAMRKVIHSILYKVYSIKQKKDPIYHIPYTKYFLLADAFHIKYVKGIGLKNQKAIIHGDRISISIAAASIIAKVARDKLMDKLSVKHPEFHWQKNKGYGTREHIEALKKYGKTSLHRDLYLRKIEIG